MGKEQPFTVHFDFDEVISDTNEGALEKIKENEGVDLTLKEVNYWDFISDNENYFKHFVKLWTNEEEFLKYAKPIDGVKELMEKTQEAYGKENVHVLTAGESWEGKKSPIIREWTGIPEDQMIYDPKKYRHATSSSVLIDDKPANLVKYVDAGGQGVLYNKDDSYGWSSPETIDWEKERTVTKEELLKHLKSGKIQRATNYDEVGEAIREAYKKVSQTKQKTATKAKKASQTLSK